MLAYLATNIENYGTNADASFNLLANKEEQAFNLYFCKIWSPSTFKKDRDYIS